MEKIEKNRPLFDKQKCVKCKWHGVGIGYPVKVMQAGHEVTALIHCNYSSYHESSCLRAKSANEVIDIRGTDYDNCLLFEEGKVEKVEID